MNAQLEMPVAAKIETASAAAEQSKEPDSRSLAENLQADCRNIDGANLLSSNQADCAAKDAAAVMRNAVQNLPEWQRNKDQLKIAHISGSTSSDEIIQNNV